MNTRLLLNPERSQRKSCYRYAGAVIFVISILTSGAAWADDSSSWLVLAPQGPVADAENTIMIIDVAIMLGIVVPTITMAVLFAWRYRATNPRGKYSPHWARSWIIEVGMWGIPFITVIGLSYLAVWGTMYTDIYSPNVLKNSDKPLDINVVSLDWKWLFIYPEQNIATVGTVHIPVNRRVRFRLTSATVSNIFFIPQLAGQMMAMPGMRTQAVMAASHPGTYPGFSSNFSGAGFSWMRFSTIAVSEKGFDRWIHKVQQSPRKLTHETFENLAQPSINTENKVRFYSSVTPHLFMYVIKQVNGGKVYPSGLFSGKAMAADG
ncbi:COX aromatic rich motif-containing protein [Salinisphaera sp.]|uniref:COX aromatic rich motif-containing protein n=1 Tax=Salinisphaera sp. TaxID=1914330 RepID=UPI002D783169|nr:COX aromatic rich motif-containing protein [Salinisphaera sp.]HET7313036.1 COX aromatic rich motif-containing protein [Salinisphaera sp.]